MPMTARAATARRSRYNVFACCCECQRFAITPLRFDVVHTHRCHAHPPVRPLLLISNDDAHAREALIPPPFATPRHDAKTNSPAMRDAVRCLMFR